MQYPPPGYNFAPAYQISGLPYVTSSAANASLNLKFPYVTKFITIRANGGAVDFSFTANGLVGTNHFTLANNEVLTMDLRVKEMWLNIAGTAHVVAGLTGIPTASIPNLTSSYAFNPADPYFTGSNAFTNVLVYEGCG